MKDLIAVRVQLRRTAATAVSLKMGREDLFQEISNTLYQLPEKERQIFFQAHYHGQSLESISCAYEMDLGEIKQILQKCDQQLQLSLSKYRECGYAGPTIPAAKIVCLSA